MRVLLPLLPVALVLGCSPPVGVTAEDAVAAFEAAGLAAPNPRDVTDTQCPDTGCEEAVATDVVTISRFSDAQSSHVHSTALQQPAYAVGEFVIAFPVGTDVPTNEYATVLAQAIDDAEQ